MTNDFGQRVYPVIRYVIGVLEKVRNAARTGGASASEVASQLKTLLTQFDVQGPRRDEFELAKRALVYWIDEVLISSDWEEAGWWSHHTLERHFFDSRERAWRFFEKAAVARQLDSLDALETFYLCACLGFQGIYRDRRSDATSQRPAGDDVTPPEMPLVRDAEEAQDAVGSQTSAEKSPAVWWDDEPDDASAAASVPGFGTVDISRRELERMASATGAKANAPDEPETLRDWIESVYRQIAPAPPEPYSPLGSPQEPGDAAPLTGRSSRGWALLSAMLAGMFLITLAIITLYQA